MTSGSAAPAGRRWLWDLLSSQDEATARMQEPVRQLATEHLGLRTGLTVLDAGCGSGGNLGALRTSVGAQGRVVGIDFSPKMVRRAHERIEANGWANVEVRGGDLTTDRLDHDAFDAALATFALSATSDVRAAVENVHQALRPGGRLFVCDLRLVPAGRSAAVIWLAGLCYRWVAGWRGLDVLDQLQATFDTTEVVGSLRPWPPVIVAVATKLAAAPTP
ncbi:MAG: class I SAM-dependent methyltransferase [Acidimicrobiales bacterium]